MLLQMLPQLQNNPAAMLMQRGFNIPQGQNMGPQAIIEHLMNTGQVDQNAYNNAIKMARTMGYQI